MALLPETLSVGQGGRLSRQVQLHKKANSWVDVRADFGATADGTTDDTAAIQAAINALPTNGGTVRFGPGTFKLTDALTLRSKIRLVGAGDGSTVLQQTVAGKDILTGSALQRITVEGIWLQGTGSGTGNGINLTKGGNAATFYITLRDITVTSAGQDGVAVENGVVSVFDRVQAVTCGRYGIHLYGQTGGASGTSCSLNSCYANACGTAGYRVYNMAYTDLRGCAADANPIGYLVDTCQSVKIGGGTEGPVTNGLKITGGYGIVVEPFWVYNNKGVAIWVTGAAQRVTLMGAVDNSPNGTATNFIKVDSGCQAALINCNNTTANSLAVGTTTTLV